MSYPHAKQHSEGRRPFVYYFYNNPAFDFPGSQGSSKTSKMDLQESRETEFPDL